MCKVKPGARCFKHAGTSYRSALGRLERAHAAYRKARAVGASATRLQLTRERRDAARENAEAATMDFDATPTQQQKLRQALDSDGLSRKDRAAIEERLTQGQAMRQARRDQVHSMPPLPEESADPEVKKAFEDLGRHREKLAYLTAKRATANEAQQARLDRQEHTIENDLFAADVNYRVLAAQSTPDMRYLDREELLTVRACPEEARPGLRQKAVYLSHLRAAAADPIANHPDRFASVVTDRENRFREDIRAAREAAQPNSTPEATANGDSAPETRKPANGAGPSGNNAAMRPRTGLGRRSLAGGLLGKGGLLDQTLDVAEKLADAQPGKRQGAPINFPGRVS